MGLFSSKSKSSSKTTNYSTTVSQSLGDLSKQNVLASGDVTINGLWGEDAQAFLENAKELALDALVNVADVANAAATSNSNLAGQAIQQVAAGYQSAYSESTGMLQQIKPVLIVGLAAFALAYAGKYWR